MAEQAHQDKNTRNILTPKGMVSHPHLDQASEYKKGDGRPTYSVTLVFEPKVQTTEKYKALLRMLVKVATVEFGPDAAQLIRDGKIRLPFRPNPFDPADELPKEYPEGSRYVRCGRKEKWGKPGLANWNKDVIDAKDLYPGSFALAHVTVFPWANKGRKGLSLGLNHVQKLDDGERLDSGSRIALTDAFDKHEAPEPKEFDDLPDAAKRGEPSGADDPEVDVDIDDLLDAV